MKSQLQFATLILAFLYLLPLSSTAQGIQFETGTWEEVKAKAKETNKPIFVDAYTTWCGPCKWMANNTFTVEEVGTYMNKNFISIKIDMEKGEGITFAKEHKVNVFPTLLYFSANGELMHKGIGAKDAEQLLSLSKDATDPSKQIAKFHKKYIEGNYTKAFLKEYIQVLTDAYEETKEPFKKYWNMLSKKEKFSEETLNIMKNSTNNFSNFEDPYVAFFLKNQKEYIKNTSEEQVTSYANSAFFNSFWFLATIKDKKTYKQAVKKLATFFPKKKKEIAPSVAYFKANKQKDSLLIIKTTAKMLKVTTNHHFLNKKAWNVFENSDNPATIKKAIGWINRSIAIEQKYSNTDTKAALLFKNKQYKEAKKAAKEAIALAKEEETDYQITQELLNKINAAIKK